MAGQDFSSFSINAQAFPQTRARVASIFCSKQGDQFAVGGDQRLFGVDLGDDGLRWTSLNARGIY